MDQVKYAQFLTHFCYLKFLFRQETPVNQNLKIGTDTFVLNKQDGDLSKNIDVKQEEITSVVYYKDATGQPAVMKYVSPFDKSDKIRNGK